MQDVKLIAKLHQDFRFRIPTKLQRRNSDIESGSYYEIVIKRKVKDSDDGDMDDDIQYGAMADLISEKS